MNEKRANTRSNEQTSSEELMLNCKKMHMDDYVNTVLLLEPFSLSHPSKMMGLGLVSDTF